MPKSIKTFEQLYLATLLMGIFNSILLFDTVVAQGVSPAFVLFVQAFVVLVLAGLVLLISRKRSNIAKWVLVVLFVVGFFPAITQIAEFLAQGVVGVISVMQLCMQTYAMYLLFTSDSKEWFSSKTESVETEAIQEND